MRRRKFLAAIGVASLATGLITLTSTLIQAQDAGAAAAMLTYLDIRPQANQKLDEPLHGFEDSNLAELPKGEQAFKGVKFKIDEGYICLGSTLAIEKPDKVQGIGVGQAFTKLHILHGDAFGAHGEPGSPGFVEDGTEVGEYTLYYEDGTSASIPIVYGKDVRDWWSWDKPVDITRGQIAWEGKSAAARKAGQLVRLYMVTWENPKPDQKVLSIDYVSTFKSAAAPFLVAITLERK